MKFKHAHWYIIIHDSGSIIIASNKCTQAQRATTPLAPQEIDTGTLGWATTSLAPQKIDRGTLGQSTTLVPQEIDRGTSGQSQAMHRYKNHNTVKSRKQGQAGSHVTIKQLIRPIMAVRQ